MLKFTSVMIGSAQPKVIGEFYQKVFAIDPMMAEGDYFRWDLGGCMVTVGEHSEVKGQAKEPQRIILNLETEDVRGEFARIKKALPEIQVVKRPYEMEGWEGGWIATLADPDGNYFQLMTPWSN